uniref:Uncharacterized protein n=1 Tax=Romanomermis culicivorax TaxID=13658 RepID=A0A915K904_ROMCU
MSLFTSVFWSIFTADSLVKGIIKKPDYSLYKSPETYPLLETVDCSSKYLSLAYLCDPDHWLTHTEAQKFDHFFKNRLRRLEICRGLSARELRKNDQKGPVDNSHPKFVVGFAFADNLKTTQFRNRRLAMRSIQNTRKVTSDDHFCTVNDGNVEKTAFTYETRSAEFDPIIQKSLDFSADRIRHRWNMEIEQ